MAGTAPGMGGGAVVLAAAVAGVVGRGGAVDAAVGFGSVTVVAGVVAGVVVGGAPGAPVAVLSDGENHPAAAAATAAALTTPSSTTRRPPGVTPRTLASGRRRDADPEPIRGLCQARALDVQRRDLHILLADAAGTAVVTSEDGALPILRVELRAGEATVTGARRAVHEAWGLDLPIVEVHVDFDRVHEDEAAGSAPALIVVESAAAGWAIVPGLRWLSLDGPDPRVEPGLETRLQELLRERRGDVDVPARRPPWSRPGWYARASRWIEAELVSGGRPPTGPIEQVRHWGLSALMRVPTSDGDVWFKAVFPLFASEPAVTALMHREAPGAVPPVLAVHEAEGWLLLGDVGQDVVAAHADADDTTVRQLVALQRAFIDRVPDLLASGCPARGFASLPDDLSAVLADPATLDWINVPPARAAAIVAWVRSAVADADPLGYPDTLVHGDFHPHNVAVVAGRPVIFDWSDAAVAHPLVDIAIWTGWLADDADRGERGWQVFLDAWSDVCPIEAVTPLRATLVGLADGYHTVSYARIVAALEPLRRPEIAHGLQTYFGRLDAAVPVDDPVLNPGQGHR